MNPVELTANNESIVYVNLLKYLGSWINDSPDPDKKSILGYKCREMHS